LSLEGENTEFGSVPPAEPAELSPLADAFYSGAAARITRYIPVLGALGAVLAWWRGGAWFAAGFVVGGAISYVNFYWLKRVVNALAERVTHSGRSEGGRTALTRFLFRYALIAVAAYVIFNISARSLFGMLAGLFLPAAAIVCEAVYEAYVALRRGW